MSFIQPIPCDDGGGGSAICCPNIFTGYCLNDGTPIAITIVNGVQTTWTNLMTGVVTPGAPPAGTGICPGSEVIIQPLTCETDSVTICSGDDPIEITGSVNQGTNPWITSLDAATLAALETITVVQGTSPWVIGDGGGSITVDGSVSVTQGTSPWVVQAGAERAEDTAHTTGDTGNFVLAVRNDVVGSLVDADGDYAPLQVDSTGCLRTTATLIGPIVVDYDYPEDSLHVTGDIGAFTLGVRNDAGATLTSGNGDYSAFAVDAAGRIGIADLGGSITVDGTVTVNQGTNPWVTSLDAATLAALETITVLQGTSPWVIGDGGSSITVDAIDLDIRNLVFATDKVDVSGSTVALDAGTLAALETITVLQGTSPWVIGDGGGSITVDGSVSITGTVTTADNKVEDVAHVTGDIGSFILAVRNDANTAFTNTNGDYSPIAVNASGAVAISDGGNSITVDGTVAVTQSTSPWVTSLDAATLAALESITVQNGAGAAAVNIQDGGNSITVDGSVTVSGTITTNYERAEDSPHTSTNIGAFVLAVRNDAGTPLAADQDYIPFTTDATGALRVNAGTTVTQTGRDDTDNQVPVSTGLLTSVARNYVFDGTNWDRWTGAVTQGTSPWVIGDGGGSITVDGTVSITGPVTVDTNFDHPEDSPHVSGDVGAFVLAVRNDAGTPLAANGDYIPFTTDSTGALRVTGGGGVFQHEEILCDDDVTFVRKYIQDSAGTVTSVVDFDLEGDPYVVTGTVQVCGGETPVVPQSLDSTADRLVGAGLISVSSGAKSVTVIVYAGNPTVTIDADPAVTLVPGMALTWAVDDRTESLLNAFAFNGTATSDFMVLTTSGPLEVDVLDSTVERLIGAGSVIIAAGASSTTVAVISGSPTVQIGAGPVISLSPGMSLSWSVDSDNEDLLDAFTFTGASGTDFVVTSTRI